MARGGARLGAGRPAGSPNTRTRELVAAVEAEGITPLAFLLGVMRNEKQDLCTRLDAAKAAAQYVHPKLSAVEANIDGRLGTYEAQPIPVESRQSDALEGATGTATNGHST
jgi:hypothetical protein